jgi:hypothetical protein
MLIVIGITFYIPTQRRENPPIRCVPSIRLLQGFNFSVPR